ncbi:Disease resistance protein RPS2, putative [Ricinus communis]|uniref:Disease resistance protein RPS2, putative n=1 Tax=Ricinus communis TaxID=3988 RepID=B9T8E2_RICCO|nr:Disease resistance protein RPS2, putative [Ricinus communis]
MEFLALFALGAATGTQFLKTIWAKVEVFNNIWSFISYHNRIDENKQTLKRKLEALCSVEEDINRKLEVVEFRTGKKRKREVVNWLSSVQRTKKEVRSMEQQISERKYLRIREVEELYEQGQFESPLLDVHGTIGNELLATNLVGHNPNGGVLETIWAGLMNDQVLSIGVHGPEGVGKTAIMTHIHNRLLQNATSDNATFHHVYWVTISDDSSIRKLQNDIAKEVGLDLSDEEDTRKRAAKLHQGLLRRKKCVLILDGLSCYFDQVKVGIPTEVNTCKPIITTRLSKLCRRMCCQEIIEVKPLPDGDADNLFKETLRNSLPSEVDEIAKLIVKECGGLPDKIIHIAEEMREIDDIHEWKDKLYTLQECRGSQ